MQEQMKQEHIEVEINDNQNETQRNALFQEIDQLKNKLSKTQSDNRHLAGKCRALEQKSNYSFLTDF